MTPLGWHRVFASMPADVEVGYYLQPVGGHSRSADLALIVPSLVGGRRLVWFAGWEMIGREDTGRPLQLVEMARARDKLYSEQYTGGGVNRFP